MAEKKYRIRPSKDKASPHKKRACISRSFFVSAVLLIEPRQLRCINHGSARTRNVCLSRMHALRPEDDLLLDGQVVGNRLHAFHFARQLAGAIDLKLVIHFTCQRYHTL